MQPEIHTPCSDRRPPRRPAAARRLYLQARDHTAEAGLRPGAGAARVDFAIAPEIGFQAPGFGVRWPRVAAMAFMIAIMLPLTAQPQVQPPAAHPVPAGDEAADG